MMTSKELKCASSVETHALVKAVYEGAYGIPDVPDMTGWRTTFVGLLTFTSIFYHFCGAPPSRWAWGEWVISQVVVRGCNRKIDAKRPECQKKSPTRHFQDARMGQKTG